MASISHQPFTLNLVSETTIYQNEVKCRINENDFNYSQNPSVYARVRYITGSTELPFFKPANNITIEDYVQSVSTGTITTGGTSIGNSGDDVVTSNIPIGFNFNFYGAIYDEVNISSNGNLQFTTSNSTFSAATLPITQLQSAIIPLLADLRTDVPVNAGIYTQTLGAPGDRIFCVEWVASYFGANTSFLNFQIRLYETSNKIEIVYGNLSNIGRTVSIGIQGGDITALNYKQYLYGSSIPSSGTMITYTPVYPTDYLGVIDGTLIDNITGSDFRPYATTVGLYNAANELLVVGKLATPYPIPSNTDMTFVIRWDS